jgi:hypothetical protein
MYCVVSAPGHDKSVAPADKKLLSGDPDAESSLREQVPLEGLYETLLQSATSSHEFMHVWRSGSRSSVRVLPKRRVLHWT